LAVIVFCISGANPSVDHEVAAAVPASMPPLIVVSSMVRNASTPSIPRLVAPKSVPVKPSESAPPGPVPSCAAPRRDELAEVKSLKLSPAVKTIVGLDGASGYDDRMKAMCQLNRKLPPDDVKALVLFLDVHSAAQKDLPLEELASLKNDVVDVLLRQDVWIEGLGDDLIRMFQDRTHDDVWRDYCVQYLAQYYGRKWPESAPVAGDIPDAEQISVEKALWEAVQEIDTTIAGTALLGLEQLSRTHPGIDADRVVATALVLAEDVRCSEPSRITAVRLCGMLKKKDVLPIARMLVPQGETIPLRMAALATLGDIGEKEDEPLVQYFTQDPEKRIRSLAAATLNKMQGAGSP
jgi:hypothetical protein